MAFSTKTLKDGAGADFTAPVYSAGRDAAAGSAPVALSNEDKAALDLVAARLPALENASSPVRSRNVTAGTREQGIGYTPGQIWQETTKAGGALIFADGNTNGSSYLTVSLDPINAACSALIEAALPQSQCREIVAGLSMSQRTLGQEVEFEYVSTAADEAAPADLAISSIQQATTTLTITTAVAHGLKVGDPIGIAGVTSNSALNYPAVVVATTPTATQFTVTAGPGGNLPSVTSGPFAQGTVYRRGVLGGNAHGVGVTFENGTATNASIAERAGAGTARYSGTVAGNQAVTVSTTASLQSVNTAGAYAFHPSSEFRIVAEPTRVQVLTGGVDSAAASPSVVRSATTVIPDPSLAYRVRVRAKNYASMPQVVGHIQAVAKTGTTTATVTTQTAHGLTTGDVIAAYGVRDQTNFANLTAATVVASVIDATNFTVVWGAAVTASSQSGVIVRVNGGNLPSAFGYVAQVIQSVVRTSNVLTLVGSANWSGFVIGDLVNLAALHDTAGVDLLLDGSYRVRNIATTTLEVEPVGTAPTGANIALTNCGGAVIKRTDLRIHYMRVFAFDRNRVELVPRGTNDLASAAPVQMQGGTLGTVSTVTTVTTVAAVTSAGTPTAAATPYFVNSAASTNGALILTGSSGLTAFYASNTGAGAAYVKLYNKATAPTVGTDVPEMVIPIPAAVSGVPGTYALPMGFNSFRFALGLGIAITGAAADNDTTAVAAGQVKVKLSRTV